MTLLLNPKGHALAILYNAIARVEHEVVVDIELARLEDLEVQVDILLGAIRHVEEAFDSQSCDRVQCPECGRALPDTMIDRIDR